MIKKEFEKQINHQDEIDKNSINEPVIIVFDDLLKFQDLFAKGELKLWTIIDKYISYVNSEYPFRNISSFNEFIHIETKSNKPGSPERFFVEIDRLLENFG